MNKRHSLSTLGGFAAAVAMALLSGHVVKAQSLVRYDLSGNLSQLGIEASGEMPTLQGPASRLVQPGTPSSLSVAWTGSGVSFRWFFNGAPLAGETRDTLLLSSVSAQQVGDYFVVAENSFGSTTSRVARVDLDADRDGLGDAWEIAHFGSLTNQNGYMDQDGDGTVNHLEFTDGTNPTNKNSLLARVNVATVGGRVVRSPDASTYNLNDLLALTAIPDPGLSFISWSGALIDSTNPSTLRLTGNQEVQATFGLPLAQAINTTNPVVTGGSGGWLGQTGVAVDGMAAAVAPPLVKSGDPFLVVTVPMVKEGTASFDWRIDGEENNTLEVWVNNRLEFYDTRRLVGVTGWKPKTVYLPTGTNTIRWVYVRNGGGWTESSSRPKPRDTAYVDRLVVNEYANPLLDSDGNGLPDLWEYQYLDGIGNDPEADPDEDGVKTRLELADGTDPNEKSSVRPRVSYVVDGQGTAVASPATNLYYYGQYVTNTATPAQGWSFVAWVGPFENDYFIPKLRTNNPSIDRVYQAKTFRAIFGLPLGQAVDVPELTWTTSPALPWYGQARVNNDGADAAQSAVNVDAFVQNESWLETVVTGPGTLSFFWKASTADRDYLTLLANASEITPRLSGQTDWQPVVLSLPAGQQALRWVFSRNYGYDANAQNSVWVDQVKFTAGATKPEFIEVPSSLAGYEGVDLTFRVAARGTPPVTYQVFRSGVALTQTSTNQIITVPSVSAALAGTWVVRAQNQTGSTDSPPIPVSILPLPPNDAFAEATVISGANSSIIGYSIGATAENDEPWHSDYPARASVWYRWTAPASGAVRFTAIATNPPAALALAAHQGAILSDLVDLAADDAYPQETNGVEIASVAIQWPVTAGANYAIAVDVGEGGSFFKLLWEPLLPPVNDAFAARLALTGSLLNISDDNTLATLEPGEPPIFGLPPFFALYASNSLWWSWTAPASGPLTITHQSADTTALVSIFTGSTLATLNRLTDPFGGSTSVDVVEGTTYAISAGTYGDDPGRFSFTLALEGADGLTLQIIPPGPGDDGFIDVQGSPSKLVTVQFSPNLKEWYFWASNTISMDGRWRVSLKPPTYQEGDEIISIPPASKRFFRAVASP